MHADQPGASSELATLVVRGAERIKSDFARAVSELDVPVPLARAILLLNEPAPMGCLASQLSCDQSYVTRIADELVKRELVTRAAGDDRRVQMLALTGAGEEMKERISQAVERESSLLQALSPKNQSDLRALMTRILSS